MRVHCLTDGRDVEDGTSAQYTDRLQKDLATLHEATGADAAIASGGGRMRVTMDRYEVCSRPGLAPAGVWAAVTSGGLSAQLAQRLL